MDLGLRFVVHGQVVGVCNSISKLDRMIASIKRRHGGFRHLVIEQGRS